MNTLHTMGRLTADPEMREVSGIPCLNFTLASDTRTKDAEGNTVSNFYRVTAWRKTAETMAKYLHKGDKIYVDGELTLRRYKDNNGNDRISPDLTVNQFEFVQTSRNNSGNGGQTSAPAPAPKPAPQPVEDDDLPF